MKKVGLMTCFLDNYGACLQAYALEKIVCTFGYACEIIKYTEPEGYYARNIWEYIKECSLYNLLRGFINKDYKLNYKLGKARRKKFRKFRKTYLKLTKDEYKSYSELTCLTQFDIYVCGSDQIWNPSFYGGCNPSYYLAFVPDDIPKIAYAPSIGLNDIPSKYIGDFQTYINRLQAVSVREKTGADLIWKYTNRNATWVLDPTMLIDKEEWTKLTKKTLYQKPYIFCYLFGDHDYYSDIIDRLRKETGLDIVSIPFSKQNMQICDKLFYNAGPNEFLTLIKNAEYVLTDSFHATVFSVIFERSFYTCLRNSDGENHNMNSRIYSLMSLINMEERCIRAENVKDFQIVKLDDYTEINKKVEFARKNSVHYLYSALKGTING